MIAALRHPRTLPPAAATCLLLAVTTWQCRPTRESPTPPPADGSVLNPLVTWQALPRLAETDALGLAEEAAAVATWHGGRGALRLAEGVLEREDGTKLTISPELAETLEHVNSYFSLAQATLTRPVAHEELAEAFLLPRAVDHLQELFTRSIREGLPGPRGLLPVELGGEAILTDGTLELTEIPDPFRPLLREVHRGRDDPSALRELYRERADDMRSIDEHGLLQALLERLPEWERRAVPPEKQRRMLARTLDTVLEGAANSWTLTPQSHLEHVAGRSWSGRYVGQWHLHPPALTADGWEPGAAPSPDDVEIAGSRGQYLTIAFRDDGFVVHDLSATARAVDGHVGLTIRHASEDWRAHFEVVRREVK